MPPLEEKNSYFIPLLISSYCKDSVDIMKNIVSTHFQLSGYSALLYNLVLLSFIHSFIEVSLIIYYMSDTLKSWR